MRRGPAAIIAGLLVVELLLAACATYYVPRESGRAAGVAATAQGLSNRALERLVADMDPAMLALARRHDPVGRRSDFWGRPVGWAVLDVDTLPTLGLAGLDFEEARRINAFKPAAPYAVQAAAPFLLRASGGERDQALHCLSQAVYYEAAYESLEGRRAVAQTVLNRLRHPGYPKSVCGVVYEGAARLTGCQFSFTCDGSLQRAPVGPLWIQAQDIARQALNGYVFKPVGTSTHYHADYVLPYWAPSLLKLIQVGTHIFYRWTGPSGELRAFNGRYAGGETRISSDVLNALDDRIQGAGLAAGLPGPAVATLASAPAPQRVPGVDGLVSVVAVPDPNAPGGQRLQVTGTIAGRRIPTADEIAEINAKLGAVPAGLPAPPPPVAAPPPPPPPEATPPKPAAPTSMFGSPRQRPRGGFVAPPPP